MRRSACPDNLEIRHPMRRTTRHHTQIDKRAKASRRPRQTPLHLCRTQTFGPVSERRHPVSRRSVRRRPDFKKVNLSIGREMITNRLTTDEWHRRHSVRALAEVSKQKRVRVNSDRLILALSCAEN